MIQYIIILLILSFWTGAISEYEMLRTFNCGIGMVAVVNADNVNDVLNLITDADAYIIGCVENLNKGKQ